MNQSELRRVVVEIRCGDEHCHGCKWLWQYTIGYPAECWLFTTKRGMRRLFGNPPRRCKQCLDGEVRDE